MSDSPSNEKRQSSQESLTKFSKKMIHYLSKYKFPRLLPGCYSELNLTEGKFFSEKTIGQLVGKSGERKEEFFNLTGVKPHIEYSDNSPILVLSKYNVREIKLASLLGQRFKSTKSWSSSSINKHSQQLKTQIVTEERESGTKVLERFDSESASSAELAEVVGRMSNEQYSSTQTLLEHSIELAEEAGKAALALSLDQKRIYRLSLYHDIGKVFFPYYLHSSEKVFERLPILRDEEVKETILTHHSPLSNLSSPYISLVSLVNRVISQSHFTPNSDSEESLVLKEAFQSLLSSKGNSFYIFSSGYHYWLVFHNIEERQKLVEELTPQLEAAVSSHSANATITNLNITLYFLPKEGENTFFERVKFSRQYSKQEN